MARERWGSRIGIILAVAGSAIGLGNFLRFPAKAAAFGGGAFMIPYFISLLLLGLPLMWIEWTVGRFGGGFGHSTAPGIFHTMWNKNRFIKYFGVIGIFGPIIIFAYYTYIESWLLGYSVFALFQSYGSNPTTETLSKFFDGYTGKEHNDFFSSLWPAYLFFLVTFLANVAVVWFGIRRGIERLCKYVMPLLFVMAVVLMIRVLTLGTPDPAKPDQNVLNGLGFLWNPDWSALLKGQVWLQAAGQIFFTLSCGIGVILTYASYLSKRDDVALSGLTAAATNEFAEVILGGSIVIPVAFIFLGATGTQQAAGDWLFGLPFVTMPMVLQNLPYGFLFGFLWFALLFLAGVTSSISLAQPAVAFMEDEFNFSRREAVVVFTLVTFTLCQAVIFGYASDVLFDFDFWGGTVALVVFATVEAILFAWVFGMDKAWTEMHVGSDITIPRIYRWIIKYVTPLFLLVILGVWLVQDWKKTFLEHTPIILMSRFLLLFLFIMLALLVTIAWRHRKQRSAEP